MIKDELVSEHLVSNKKRCTYVLPEKGYDFFEKILEIHLAEVEKILPNGNEKLILDLENLNKYVTDKMGY